MADMVQYQPEESLSAVYENPDTRNLWESKFASKWFLTYLELSIPESMRLEDNATTRGTLLKTYAKDLAMKNPGRQPRWLFEAWDHGIRTYDSKLKSGEKSFRRFDIATLCAFIEDYKWIDLAPQSRELKALPQGKPAPLTRDELKEMWQRCISGKTAIERATYLLHPNRGELLSLIKSELGERYKLEIVPLAQAKYLDYVMGTMTLTDRERFKGKVEADVKAMWVSRFRTMEGYISLRHFVNESLIELGGRIIFEGHG